APPAAIWQPAQDAAACARAAGRAVPRGALQRDRDELPLRRALVLLLVDAVQSLVALGDLVLHVVDILLQLGAAAYQPAQVPFLALDLFAGLGDLLERRAVAAAQHLQLVELILHLLREARDALGVVLVHALQHLQLLATRVDVLKHLLLPGLPG